VAKRSRKELKTEIRQLEDIVYELEVKVDDLEWELGEIGETDLRNRMNDIAFEAEGRKLEGREFGSWLLSSVKRFVAYG